VTTDDLPFLSSIDASCSSPWQDPAHGHTSQSNIFGTRTSGNRQTRVTVYCTCTMLFKSHSILHMHNVVGVQSPKIACVHVQDAGKHFVGCSNGIQRSEECDGNAHRK
jgi:hypothetical protein